MQSAGLHVSGTGRVDQMLSGADERTEVAGRRARIGIVSVSMIADDPRVRRQGDLLAAAGWSVVAIGLPGARSRAPDWRCLAISEAEVPATPASVPSDRQRSADLRVAAIRAVTLGDGWNLRLRLGFLGQLLRLCVVHPGVAVRMARSAFRAARRAAVVRLAQPAVRFVRIATDQAYSDRLYWTLNSRFQALYDLACREPVDLWLANDWTTLPIARRLAAEQGVPFAYDTHELAIDEYAQRWSWRMTQRPIIAAVEGGDIRAAAFVSCVSAGIASRLSQYHRLRQPPLVIRNTPRYEKLEFRPTPERIGVLYHGVVALGRGLEDCIASVAAWRPEFSLTIRGPGGREYLDHLARRAVECGVADRVTFAPAVPMVDLVRAAAADDVGLFALPGHSRQNRHALPNKIFEYMMAGLALCISDLPEMSAILRAWNAGELIASQSAAAIAASINRLSRPAIDAYKRNSLAAARELNWENEGRRLVEACERAIAGVGNGEEGAGAPALRR